MEDKSDPEKENTLGESENNPDVTKVRESSETEDELPAFEDIDPTVWQSSNDTKRMVIYSFTHVKAAEQKVAELEEKIDDLESRIQILEAGGGGGGGTVGSIGAGLTLYGRVNQWFQKGQTVLTQDLNALVANHVCGYMIELLPWTPGSADVTSSTTQNNIKNLYNWLVDQCRSRSLMLFVSIINDNYTKNKYVIDGHRVLSQNQLESIGTWLLDNVVIPKGAEDVWVQPVAETGSTTTTWEAGACQKLVRNGFVTVYNGSGGRPSSVPSGYNFRAWHPNNTGHFPNDNLNGSTMIISDTGSIICELAGRSSTISSSDADEYLRLGCDSTKTSNWQKNVISKGFPIVGYYDFVRRDHNPAAITAMAGIAGSVNGNGYPVSSPEEFMADSYPALWCYSGNRRITGGTADGTITVSSISKGSYMHPGSITFAAHPRWITNASEESNLDWVVIGVKVPGATRYRCGFFESTSGLDGRRTRNFNNIWGDPSNNGYNYGGWDRAYFARSTEYIVAYFQNSKNGSKRTRWFHGTFPTS